MPSRKEENEVNKAFDDNYVVPMGPNVEQFEGLLEKFVGAGQARCGAFLRPDKVTEVLRKVDNQRVRRLYLYMAEKAGHVWLEDVDVEAVGLTTSPLTVERGGSFVNKYKMTIPTELYEYE